MLKGVTNEKNGGSNVSSIHRYWSRTLVIDVHFNIDLAVVFYFVYFPFPLGTAKSVGGIKKNLVLVLLPVVPLL